MGESNRGWATPVNLAEEVDAVGGDLLAQVEADVSPADWFVVIHTSGSTAEPKGVACTKTAEPTEASEPTEAVEPFGTTKAKSNVCALTSFSTQVFGTSKL